MVVVIGAVGNVIALHVHQIDAHGSALVRQGRGQVLIHGVDLGEGVGTDHDGGNLVVVVLISLDNVALAGQDLVADLGVLADQIAVVVHVSVLQDVLLGVVQVIAVGGQSSQVLVGVRNHIGGVGVVGIGAQLVAVELPGGRRTAEGVHIVLRDQLLEVLLGELHLFVVFDGLVLGGVLHVLAGGSAVDGDVAHNDAVLLVILDHGGLQHVEGVQGGLLTGHGLGAQELVIAVIQADAAGLLNHADLPVGAGVVLDGTIIAQSAQQHLHERVAAQSALRTEGAVSIAADDALLRAVGDVACEVVGHGNILEGSGACAERGGGGGAQDQVADDLGGRATGQDIVRTEIAVAVTIDDTDTGDYVDGFLIGDLTVVREVLGAGADGDQGHGHHQSKHLSNFFARRVRIPTPREKAGIRPPGRIRRIGTAFEF